MKKFILFSPLLLGAGGLLLRWAQRRAVLEPDTGLARSHWLTPLLLAYLLGAALFFFLPAWRRGGTGLSLAHSFALPENRPPFDLVAGAMLYLAAGALLLVQSVGSGDLIPLILAALSVVAGMSLLLSLRLWRGGRSPGSLLLPPIFLWLILLLTTYQQFASHPVTQAFYVGVLAQAAAVMAFHQIAAHGFGQGRRRPVSWSLPIAITLALAALPDARSLPQAGMYLAAAASLFPFWRCLGEYTPPEAAEDSGEREES